MEWLSKSMSHDAWDVFETSSVQWQFHFRIQKIVTRGKVTRVSVQTYVLNKNPCTAVPFKRQQELTARFAQIVTKILQIVSLLLIRFYRVLRCRRKMDCLAF